MTNTSIQFGYHRIMPVTECFICFCECEDPANDIVCSECEIPICCECANQSLEYCLALKSQPMCYNCKEPLTSSSFKGSNLLPTYYKVGFEYIMGESKDDNQQYLYALDYLKSIRENRQRAISRFPKGIKATLDICFSEKIKKLDDVAFSGAIKRAQKEKEKKIIALGTCPNPVCIGTLSKISRTTKKCSVCEVEYCTKCEEIKTNNNHECNKDTLENIKFLSTIVKCPSCSVNIIRSSGCAMMTCTNCKANFCYRTGEITQFGNNHNTPFEKKEVYTISDFITDKDILKAVSKQFSFTPEKIQKLQKTLEDYVKKTFTKKRTQATEKNVVDTYYKIRSLKKEEEKYNKVCVALFPIRKTVTLAQFYEVLNKI